MAVIGDRVTSDTAKPARIRQILFSPWFRLAGAAVLLALLFRLGVIDAASFFALISSPGAVATALGLILAGVHIGIFRWSLLLKLQGVRIPFARLWHATLVAMFSGTFLPGGLAQDAVRIFYAAREPGCRMGTAVTSIVADRLVGLAGLLAAAALFIAVNVDRIATSAVLQVVAAATIGCALATLVLFAGAIVLGNSRWLRQWLRALAERTGRVARLINPVIEAARLYHGRIGGVLVCFLLSVLVHICMTAAVIVLASTMDLGNIDWTELGLASALSYLANVLPITPGGIGVGEATFDQLCRLLSSDQQPMSYGSVFLAARTLSIAVSLLGAVSLVIRRTQKKPG